MFEPLQSIEGWVIMVAGVHEEAEEDSVIDKFSDFGKVQSIHMNLDRRTGFAKGYALIEYGEYEEAVEAIRKMNNTNLYNQTIRVDFAFKNGPSSATRRQLLNSPANATKPKGNVEQQQNNRRERSKSPITAKD
ncbi:hypothetical protein MP228_006326 [Amoeboaphelidium protococcarum]|nr:hypothetical protein MP228_006326 [Amoeboaphelidium protococcarum]